MSRWSHRHASVLWHHIESRIETPSPARRLLAVFSLSGVAIAQPLLSIFGETPEFFTLVNAGRVDALLWAAIVVFGPAAVLFGADFVVSLMRPGWGMAIHLATVAALVALGVVQVISSPAPGVAAAGLAVVVGVAAATIYARSGALQLWSRLLAVVPLIALGSFTLTSDASDVFGGDQEFATVDTDTRLDPDGDVAPVIMLLLDEFPTRALLDESGEIDAESFPNIARFADQSTWYRSHSTASAETTQAVPSVLTGRQPVDRPPTATAHPESLFSLFAPTHHLTVSEAVTSLCPASECGAEPIPPSATGVAETQAEAPTPPFRRRLMYRRTASVLFDRVVPGRDASANVVDFGEQVAAPGRGQPQRFQTMANLIGPSEVPTLYFLHLLLPHVPWQFHPDGTQYRVAGDHAGTVDLLRTDPWLVEVNRMRLRRQARHLDGLVGEMLFRFNEAGIYDDAVVVLAADHGITFETGQQARDFTGTAPSDVLYTPLLIKAPGQTEGEIDTSNAQAIDIVPTVAAAAGLRVPWSVDGVDLETGAQGERADQKSAVSFGGALSVIEAGESQFSQGELDADLSRDGLPPVDPPGDLQLLYASLGEAQDLFRAPFEAGPSSDPVGVELQDREDLESPAVGEPPVGVVGGSLRSEAADDAIVVLAVDGTIVGLSPLVDVDGDAPGFTILLPSDALVPGADHQLGVGVWSPDTGLERAELE